jgi:ABC-type multidrug transport system fused ATPase/permease subunit
MTTAKTKISKRNLARIFRYLKPYLALEFLVAVGMMIMVGLALIDPLVLKILIDDVLIDKNTSLLTVLMAALIGLFILRGVFYILNTYLITFIGQRILFDIRCGLFQHMERLHLGFFSKTKTGEIMSRINNDVDRLQGIMSTTLLTLLSMTLFPILFVSQVYLGKRIKRRSKDAREKSANVLSFFQEIFTGISLVQSYVKEKYEARRLVRKNRELIDSRIKLGLLGGVAGAVAGFLAALGPALVLWYGGRQVIQGALTVGGLVAFYAYVGRLFSPVLRLAQHNVTIQTAMASVERIFEYLDIAPEIKDKPQSITMRDTRGEIAFRNITFSYDHHEPIIRDLSFTAHPGQRIAIVGRSGAGKSTIANLICRFFDPQSGGILLDGHDIRDLKLRSYRKQIGLVSQETVLFNSTIGENIRYGKSRAGEREIIAAAGQAQIHEFIETLPEKYDTPIGDRGVRLSGGERQRLSIARAILKNPRVLILDEATSALDTKSERLIQDSLESLMKNRTSIIIAHRLSAIVNVDRILVLDHGVLVESGKHETLLQADGIYHMLWTEMARQEEKNHS